MRLDPAVSPVAATLSAAQTSDAAPPAVQAQRAPTAASTPRAMIAIEPLPLAIGDAIAAGLRAAELSTQACDAAFAPFADPARADAGGRLRARLAAEGVDAATLDRIDAAVVRLARESAGLAAAGPDGGRDGFRAAADALRAEVAAAVGASVPASVGLSVDRPIRLLDLTRAA